MRTGSGVYVLFSALFIAIPLILSSYPLLGFFPTYVASPHDLEPGTRFTYYGIVTDMVFWNRSSLHIVEADVTYLGSDAYEVNLTLYKLEGWMHVSIRPLREGGFSFTAENVTVLCNARVPLSYQNSSFARLVTPKAGEATVAIYGGVAYRDFKRAGFKGRGFFSLATPEAYLGFARTYVAEVVGLSTNESLANWVDLPIFVRMGDRYLATNMRLFHPAIPQTLLNDFGSACPALKSTLEQYFKDVEEKKGRIPIPPREELFLDYVSHIPSDQAWAEAFWDNFNVALFPVSYVFVAAGLALLILRLRKA